MRSDILKFTAAVLLGIGGTASAVEVEVEAERLFVPTGYDDNDQIQVVVDGVLPSTCYELAGGEVTVDEATRSITLHPTAIVKDVPCLQVLVPYTHVFNLGSMPYGNFDIKVRGADVKSLVIHEATNAGPDDLLYAAIDNAYVEDIPALNEKRIVLEGIYTNSCMVWEKTDIIIRDPQVIEVLPTVRLVDRDDCEDRVIPFKGVNVKLPDLGEKGRYLLHVRSMNGKSVNRVFSYEPE